MAKYVQTVVRLFLKRNVKREKDKHLLKRIIYQEQSPALKRLPSFHRKGKETRMSGKSTRRTNDIDPLTKEREAFQTKPLRPLSIRTHVTPMTPQNWWARVERATRCTAFFHFPQTPPCKFCISHAMPVDVGRRNAGKSHHLIERPLSQVACPRFLLRLSAESSWPLPRDDCRRDPARGQFSAGSFTSFETSAGAHSVCTVQIAGWARGGGCFRVERWPIARLTSSGLV